MMNYLQKKKQALMNKVESGVTTVQVVTSSTSSSLATLDITVNGVTNTYSHRQLENNQTIFGNVLMWYRDGWNMVTLGEVDLNGTPTQFGTFNNWYYYTTKDYEITGNRYTTNGVRVATASMDGRMASVLIVDSDDTLCKRYDDSQTYNEAVEVYYSGGWKVKANQDVEYNGVTYHNGETITQWNYQTDVDIDITIL